MMALLVNAFLFIAMNVPRFINVQSMREHAFVARCHPNPLMCFGGSLSFEPFRLRPLLIIEVVHSSL